MNRILKLIDRVNQLQCTILFKVLRSIPNLHLVGQVLETLKDPRYEHAVRTFLSKNPVYPIIYDRVDFNAYLEQTLVLMGEKLKAESLIN